MHPRQWQNRCRVQSLLPSAMLAVVLSATPVSAAGESGEQRAKEAAVAMQRGQADRATQLYTEALADTGLPNSRRASIHNDRGVAFARLNQPRVAIDDFNRAVQLSPETPSVYNNRGNVLLSIGFAREALKDFDRAVLLSPGYAAAYSNRANAHARLGENDAAIRDFGQAIRLTPQNPAALAGRGRLHLSQNRPFAAVRDFSRAVSHDARFSPGYRARADAKLLLLKFEEAIEDLSRAVAFDTNNLDLYLLRGYAYLAAKNTSSAIKDFQRAAEISPRSSAALEGLALSNAKAEAYDDALNDLSKAIELEPRSAQAYAYRALVYKWMGQPELGAKDVERAVKLDAARPEVLWAKGEIIEATGTASDAIPDLRNALAGRPLLRDAHAALERLGAPIEEVEVPELAFDKWRVFNQRGRLMASHAELARLSVPLETMSDQPPRILEWDTKKVPKGIGFLRFSAGQIDGKDGPEDVEHGAVIDLNTRSVITVDTVRQGKLNAKWTWEDNKLIVAGIDNYTEEYTLKPKAAAPPVAAAPAPRRVASDRPSSNSGGGNGTPSWAPWAQNWGGGGGGGGKPKQTKSLFDLIFKGN